MEPGPGVSGTPSVHSPHVPFGFSSVRLVLDVAKMCISTLNLVKVSLTSTGRKLMQISQ